MASFANPSRNPLGGALLLGAALALLTPAPRAQLDVELEQVLFADDGVPDAQFGHSVSIEGRRVAVGAPGLPESDVEGAVYVFVSTANGWQQEARLTPPVPPGLYSYFGLHTALARNRIAVSAPREDFGAGAIHVFERSTGGWSYVAKIQPDDSQVQGHFGTGLDLEGETLVGGAHFANSSGTAYVFSLIQGSWSQTATLSPSDGALDDQFGFKVGISGDDILCGSRFDDDGGSRSGSVYAFRRERGVWFEQAKLTASDADTLEDFGEDLALVAGRAAVAAGSGVYSFRRLASGSWLEVDKLPAPVNSFGSSLALTRTLSVGAWHAPPGEAGAAYVYMPAVGGGWSLVSVQQPPALDPGDEYGLSISQSDSRLAVGSRSNDQLGSNAGAVYVYRLSPDPGRQPQTAPE